MDKLLPIQTKNASAITMSSREIAELCEKEHKLVIRDIRTMLIQLYGEEYVEKNVPEHYRNRHSEYIRENADAILAAVCGDGTNWNHQKKPYSWARDNRGYITHFNLDKGHTFTLIAGYNVKLRKKIIDRWQELEHRQAVKLPQSFAEALRLAADLEEQRQTLLLENQQQSTQIASMESYFRNGISPFEFVKGLNGVNSLKVGDFLIGKNWLYQDGNKKRVKSYARDMYLTEETTEITQHGKEPFVAYKPVLLKKGAAKLYEWYSKGILPMKANWNGEFTQDKAVGL